MPERELNISINRETSERFVCFLLQNHNSYKPLISKITPDLFDSSSEGHLAIIWKYYQEYIHEENRFPDIDEFELFVASRIASNSYLYQGSIGKDIQLFFDRLRQEPCELTEKVIETLYRGLIRRRTVRRLQNELSNINNNYSRLDEILQRIGSELEVTKIPFQKPISFRIPESLDILIPDTDLLPYGIQFLDEFLGGGSKRSETNLLIGPTGVGKSLFSLMLGVKWAENWYGSGRDPGLCIYVSYELDRYAISRRLICQSARISPKTLDSFIARYKNNPAGLKLNGDMPTGSRNNGDFEYQLLSRIKKAKEITDLYFRFADFSGTRFEDGTCYGYGGIPELVDYLKRLQDTEGRKVAVVILDWIGAAVNRSLSARKSMSDNIYSIELSRFVQESYDLITREFDCVLWLVHQLAGAKLSLDPAKLPTHGDASWCKNLAQYVDFAFTFSNADHKNRVRFGCTKHRRTSKSTPVILSLDETLLFVKVSSSVICDPYGRYLDAAEIQDEAYES